jgi:hypothetical protein
MPMERANREPRLPIGSLFLVLPLYCLTIVYVALRSLLAYWLSIGSPLALHWLSIGSPLDLYWLSIERQ